MLSLTYPDLSRAFRACLPLYLPETRSLLDVVAALSIYPEVTVLYHCHNLKQAD